MSLFPGHRWLLPGWAFCLCLCLSGCDSSLTNRSDEEKEPYFQRGKTLANSLDYKGAAEAFERALEVNPHNGLAHFELGLLYQRDEMDLTAAIYHLNRFLQLRPDSEQAEFVRQRITTCKQDLAKAISISLTPFTQSLQHDLEKANKDNARLMTENQELRRQLESWQAYAARNPTPVPAPTNPATPPGAARTEETPSRSSRSSSSDVADARTDRATPPTASRTYVVKRGDSFYSISKKYSVKMSALQAANPSLDSRRLKAGQTVRIPAQ